MPAYKSSLHHPTRLSESLLRLREEKGLSRKEMGEIVDKSMTSWYNYESGVIPPPDQVVDQICEHFKITRAELLERAADMEDEEEPEAPEQAEKVPEEKPPAPAAPEPAPAEPRRGRGGRPGKTRQESPAQPEEEKTAEPEEAQEEEPEEPPTLSQEYGLEIIIQSLSGGSITAEEVLARVEKVAPQAEAIYVKPEDNRVYWTSANSSGSFPIWR